MRFLRCAAAIGSAIAVAAAPRPVVAQEATEPKVFCRTGRPLPECRTFLVATLNYYPIPAAKAEADIPWKVVEWEVGWMTNLSAADAMGASITLGTGETGFHWAVKGRYRRWMTRSAAIDGSAGFIVAQHPPDVYPHETIYGVSGGLSMGLTDWIAVGAQVRALVRTSDGEPVNEVDVGVRLGTAPGLLATVLGGAYLISGAVRAP